ncbi:MAG TPA: CHAP domain-containing protein [Spirochaetia bacterium]|nr:CHAP domain-containing protein [Spirochaetia bacterium]
MNRSARCGRTTGSYLAVAGAALLLASCATMPFAARAVDPARANADPAPNPVVGPATYRPPIGEVAFPNEKLTPVQQRLLAGARYVLGKTSLEVNGQHFTYDCAGTILAIYAYAGINLGRRFANYTGGGVSRIYQIMNANKLLYTSYYPQPGDIIFWDNTYDENGNGKWDDELTHAGMVVGVSPNGEISYIHQNYARGIVIERMNLLYPSVYTRIIDGVKVTINSPMRMRGSPPGPYWLSGQLIRSLGKGYLLKS